MAKVKNHVIYRDSQHELRRLAEEYQMIGRHIKLEAGKLTVFAFPKKYYKNKESNG